MNSIDDLSSLMHSMIFVSKVSPASTGFNALLLSILQSPTTHKNSLSWENNSKKGAIKENE